MNKHQIRRLIGYTLWAVGLILFLPPALLDPHGPISFYHFLLFNGLVACLLGGFLLVDGANSALDRIAHHQPTQATPMLGSVEDRSHADKHYHPSAVSETFEDHRPDDMPAARALLALVLGLLVVCALIAVIMYGSGPGRDIRDSPAQERAQTATPR